MWGPDGDAEDRVAPAAADPRALAFPGVFTYLLAAPIVHFVHGGAEHGFGSHGFRFGIPVIAALAYTSRKGVGSGSDDRDRNATNLALVGMMGAVAIDAVIAWDPAVRAGAEKAQLAPRVGIQKEGMTFGLAGVF